MELLRVFYVFRKLLHLGFNKESNYVATNFKLMHHPFLGKIPAVCEIGLLTHGKHPRRDERIESYCQLYCAFISQVISVKKGLFLVAWKSGEVLYVEALFFLKAYV